MEITVEPNGIVNGEAKIVPVNRESFALSDYDVELTEIDISIISINKDESSSGYLKAVITISDMTKTTYFYPGIVSRKTLRFPLPESIGGANLGEPITVDYEFTSFSTSQYNLTIKPILYFKVSQDDVDDFSLIVPKSLQTINVFDLEREQSLRITVYNELNYEYGFSLLYPAPQGGIFPSNIAMNNTQEELLHLNIRLSSEHGASYIVDILLGPYLKQSTVIGDDESVDLYFHVTQGYMDEVRKYLATNGFLPIVFHIKPYNPPRSAMDIVSLIITSSSGLHLYYIPPYYTNYGNGEVTWSSLLEAEDFISTYVPYTNIFIPMDYYDTDTMKNIHYSSMMIFSLGVYDAPTEKVTRKQIYGHLIINLKPKIPSLNKTPDSSNYYTADDLPGYTYYEIRLKSEIFQGAPITVSIKDFAPGWGSDLPDIPDSFLAGLTLTQFGIETAIYIGFMSLLESLSYGLTIVQVGLYGYEAIRQAGTNDVEWSYNAGSQTYTFKWIKGPFADATKDRGILVYVFNAELYYPRTGRVPVDIWIHISSPDLALDREWYFRGEIYVARSG